MNKYIEWEAIQRRRGGSRASPQPLGLPLEGKLSAEFKRRLTDEVFKLRTDQASELAYLNTSSDLGF